MFFDEARFGRISDISYCWCFEGYPSNEYSRLNLNKRTAYLQAFPDIYRLLKLKVTTLDYISLY